MSNCFSHLDELESAAIRSRAKFLSEEERTDRVKELQAQIEVESDSYRKSKLIEELDLVQNPE